MANLAQCERITARAIIENNFDFVGKDVHLFRSVLKMTLKEFGEKIGVTDVAVLRWEKGGVLPHAQKVLIKSFMRYHLGFIPAPTFVRVNSNGNLFQKHSFSERSNH